MINEALYHPERAVFRARTGGAFNFPNGNGVIVKGTGSGSGQTFPEVGTVPQARTFEANVLIETEGVNVLGNANCDFEAFGIKVGDYLWNGGAGGSAVRRIKAIASATRLELEQEFPSDLTDSPLFVCGTQDFKLIVIDNTHVSEDATVQEAPLAAGKNFLDGGAPVAYDAGSATLEITAHR